jgi:hypothetical protein
MTLRNVKIRSLPVAYSMTDSLEPKEAQNVATPIGDVQYAAGDVKKQVTIVN